MATISTEETQANLESRLALAKNEKEKAERDMKKYVKDADRYYEAEARLGRAKIELNALEKQLKNQSASDRQQVNQHRSERSSASNNRYPDTKSESSNKLEKLKTDLEEAKKNILQAEIEIEKAERDMQKHVKDADRYYKAEARRDRAKANYQKLFKKINVIKKSVKAFEENLTQRPQEQSVSPQQTKEQELKKIGIKLEKLNETIQKSSIEVDIAENNKRKHPKDEIYQEKAGNEHRKKVDQHRSLLKQKSGLEKRVAKLKNELTETKQKETIEQKIEPKKVKAVRTEPVVEENKRVRIDKTIGEVADSSQKRPSITLTDQNYDGRSTKEYKNEPIVIPPKENLDRRETLAKIKSNLADKKIETIADSSQKRPSITLTDQNYDGKSTKEYEEKSVPVLPKDTLDRRQTLSKINAELASKKISEVKPKEHQVIEDKANDLLKKLEINEEKLAKYTTRGKTLWGKVKNFLDRGKISELKNDIHITKQELKTLQATQKVPVGDSLSEKVKESQKRSQQIRKTNESKENLTFPKVNPGKSI